MQLLMPFSKTEKKLLAPVLILLLQEKCIIGLIEELRKVA